MFSGNAWLSRWYVLDSRIDFAEVERARNGPRAEKALQKLRERMDEGHEQGQPHQVEQAVECDQRIQRVRDPDESDDAEQQDSQRARLQELIGAQL